MSTITKVCNTVTLKPPMVIVANIFPKARQTSFVKKFSTGLDQPSSSYPSFFLFFLFLMMVAKSKTGRSRVLVPSRSSSMAAGRGIKPYHFFKIILPSTMHDMTLVINHKCTIHSIYTLICIK